MLNEDQKPSFLKAVYSHSKDGFTSKAGVQLFIVVTEELKKELEQFAITDRLGVIDALRELGINSSPNGAREIAISEVKGFIELCEANGTSCDASKKFLSDALNVPTMFAAVQDAAKAGANVIPFLKEGAEAKEPGSMSDAIKRARDLKAIQDALGNPGRNTGFEKN